VNIGHKISENDLHHHMSALEYSGFLSKYATSYHSSQPEGPSSWNFSLVRLTLLEPLCINTSILGELPAWTEEFQVPNERVSKAMGKTHRFYYGWVIVAVSFLTLLVALGIRFSFGVFYVAILKEYGWGRAETAGAFSLSMVIHGFFAMVTGTLIDRFGPRKLFPLGAIFVAMGLAAASRINAIWHLYLFFGVVITMGTNTLAFAPHMSRIPRWFNRKRGLASGVVVAGIGVGTMVMAPLIQFVIETVDWRSAFLMLAGIVLIVVVPITALFQRRSPEEVGQFPDGIIPPSRRGHAPQPQGFQKDTRFSGASGQRALRAALCTRGFWWLVLVNFAAGFSFSMLVVHQAAHVVDAGYSLSLAALLIGLVGLLNSAGGILCGFLSDRMGREIVYSLGAASALVGVLLFLLVCDTSTSWMLYAFVILFGLGHGSIPPIYAATAADLFSGNAMGRIMGTFSIGWGTGGALGPYLGGYFYDKLGSYSFPFLLVLVSISLGVLAIWMAAPRHRGNSSP
jgi:MFS family permease